jgi:TetR/AcrR family transcriptional repressor of nem operon
MGRTKDFDEKEVLKKAVSIFWDKGYNGTSMQDLVDGLGISRSSLYDTFGDKHQLYLKALGAYQQNYGGQLCTLVSKSQTAETAVHDLMTMVVNELLADKQRRGCFMVNAGIELASHDTEVSKMICQTENQLEETFLSVIERGQANGEIAKDKDARALARFLNNTVKGIQVSIKSTTERAFFDDIIRTALTVLN